MSGSIHVGLGLSDSETRRVLSGAALLNGIPARRGRFPLRPSLSRIDRGKKIPEVYDAIDRFEDILTRENDFYDMLRGQVG